MKFANCSEVGPVSITVKIVGGDPKGNSSVSKGKGSGTGSQNVMGPDSDTSEIATIIKKFIEKRFTCSSSDLNECSERVG